jgi:hypothetical protein
VTKWADWYRRRTGVTVHPWVAASAGAGRRRWVGGDVGTGRRTGRSTRGTMSGDWTKRGTQSSIRFSRDTSDTRSLGSPVKNAFYGPISSAEVPDTCTRGHDGSEHVDTHDNIG